MLASERRQIRERLIALGFEEHRRTRHGMLYRVRARDGWQYHLLPDAHHGADPRGVKNNIAALRRLERRSPGRQPDA